MKHAYRWTVLLGLTLVSACGGGGSSSSGSGGTPPAPTTYTVGGTISGLTASGLVLLDNGGNALTVAANAPTFAFTTALANAATYAVSIQTQPTGQTCVVTNGSGTVAAANVTSVAVSCGNVATVTVGPGPAAAAYQTFNIPLTSVTVCESGTTHCATINDVLVDTGSSGLRLMASVVAAAGLSLTPMTSNGATVHECFPYVDGYSWGTVATASVVIGGESTAAIPVQVIDDGAQPTPAAPASCTGSLTSLNSVDALDANGVLGVGVAAADCGVDCVSSAPNVYYDCPSGGNCIAASESLADQVSNPVASFAVDNNGVNLQLPTIPVGGAPTAIGSLVFGIGTQSNNTLSGSATVLTTDANGNFTTTYITQGAQTESLTDSFIDSGSNGLYFPDSSIPTCINTPLATAELYCPSSTLNLTATNQGANGNSVITSFQIANLSDISTSNFAIDDVGGTAAAGTFDWGLPFFYGRTVYVAIEGATIRGISATDGAYAY